MYSAIQTVKRQDLELLKKAEHGSGGNIANRKGKIKQTRRGLKERAQRAVSSICSSVHTTHHVLGS
jgi:hypothetical protein